MTATESDFIETDYDRLNFSDHVMTPRGLQKAIISGNGLRLVRRTGCGRDDLYFVGDLKPGDKYISVPWSMVISAREVPPPADAEKRGRGRPRKVRPEDTEGVEG